MTAIMIHNGMVINIDTAMQWQKFTSVTYSVLRLLKPANEPFQIVWILLFLIDLYKK